MRGRKPRNIGCLVKLEKGQQGVFPWSLQEDPALPTPGF